MDLNIFLASLGAIALIISTSIQCLFRGNFFHPALIYTLINCGIFIIFSFGPYNYNNNIPVSYYYQYILIILIVIIGIFLGSKQGNKVLVKDLKIKASRLTFLYWFLVFLIGVEIITFILSVNQGDFLEATVENRFENIETQTDIKNSNPLVFMFNNFKSSIIQYGAAIVTASTLWQRRNYQRILILAILLIILGFLYNSRTILFFHITIILIPSCLILKEREIIKINFKKNRKALKKIILIFVSLLIASSLLFFITNLRSIVRDSTLEKSTKNIEVIYNSEKKYRYHEVLKVLPDSIVYPALQLSLYAGGTVAFGGVATDIATKSDLYTWGSRSLNPIHRILERSSLDNGFARWARDNYRRIVKKGPSFGFGFSWWGDPASLIVDYGNVGAAIAAAIIGLLIGWMYGCISGAETPILKSASLAIITNAMILTPAVGPFGFFPSFLSLIWLSFYLLNSSISKKKYYKMFYK